MQHSQFTAAPRLFGYEDGFNTQSWPCSTEGFLLAFAFMWAGRTVRVLPRSIDVALDGLVSP